MTKETGVDISALMVKHGLVVRAIPPTKVSLLELVHQRSFPNGEIVFVEANGRKMLRVTEKNKNGGKFIVAQEKGEGSIVQDWMCSTGKRVKFFPTMEAAVLYAAERLDAEAVVAYTEDEKAQEKDLEEIEKAIRVFGEIYTEMRYGYGPALVCSLRESQREDVLALLKKNYEGEWDGFNWRFEVPVFGVLGNPATLLAVCREESSTLYDLVFPSFMRHRNMKYENPSEDEWGDRDQLYELLRVLERRARKLKGEATEEDEEDDE